MPAPPAALRAVAAAVAAAFLFTVGSGSGKAADRTAARLPQPARLGAPTVAMSVGAADLQAPVLAAGPSGQVIAGSGTVNLDHPAVAHPQLAYAAAGRAPVSAALAGEQSILAVGYLGRRLYTVAGTSASGLACCSSLQLLRGPDPNSAVAPVFLSGLDGPTAAQLVPQASGGVLAVGNPAGVWVLRVAASGRIGRPQRLAGRVTQAQELATASLPGGGAAVAWTAAVPGMPTNHEGQVVRYAVAGHNGLPRAARIALALPRGYSVDSIALAWGPGGLTLAFVESWFARGGYHSRAWAIPLPGGRPQALSATTVVAAGLRLSADSAGDMVAAWQACSPSGTTCTVQAALRAAGSGFAPALTLGEIDPGEFPVAARLPDGAALVAWVRNGSLVTTAGPTARGGLSVPVGVRGGGVADAPALAVGEDGRGALSWISGESEQRLLMARLTSPAPRVRKRGAGG